MKFAPLGGSGISASRIAFGAWAIGGWNWGGQDESEAIRAIHAAADAGITLIDTAPVYGFGRSEETVGKAIAGRRDKFVIATKVGMRWDTTKGRFYFHSDDSETRADGDIAVHIYSSPESVRLEVERSLKRLGIDCIDLIQTHWQDETTPIADTMGELVRLREEGKVRAIGACNATIAQIDEYRSAGRFDTDQEKFSMVDRGQQDEKLPYLLKEGIAFLAYSPLANGMLTGKMGPDRVFPPGDMRNTRPRFTVESRQAVTDFLQLILPIAEGRGITLTQLVLAWTLAQPGISHLLAGARSEQQSIENAAAADVELSVDEVAQITNSIGDLGDKVGSAAPPSVKKS
ncbi:MAG: aldo/keto reductase [Planctomycetaceae bacterium]